MAKKEEKEEKILSLLKQLRLGFEQDIKVYFVVTDTGVILTGVHTLKDYSDGEADVEQSDLLETFNERILNQSVAKHKQEALHYVG